jgi:thiol-disulfide isomerase/thioredoxin
LHYDTLSKLSRAGILGVLLSPFWAGICSSGHAFSSIWAAQEDRMALDLSGTFLTLEGREVQFADFEYKVLFVNFWATWCGPCRAEKPSLVALFEDLRREGLGLVAVTDEDSETVRAYIQVNPVPFDVLIDPEAKLTRRFNIWSVPWSLVLDKNGRLVHFHPGARHWNTPEIRSRLKEVLAE